MIVREDRDDDDDDGDHDDGEVEEDDDCEEEERGWYDDDDDDDHGEIHWFQGRDVHIKLPLKQYCTVLLLKVKLRRFHYAHLDGGDNNYNLLTTV